MAKRMVSPDGEELAIIGLTEHQYAMIVRALHDAWEDVRFSGPDGGTTESEPFAELLNDLDD